MVPQRRARRGLGSEVGFADSRVGKKIGSGAFKNDAARFEQAGSMGKAEGEIGILLHEEN
jgi:hypothetical protein